MKNKKRIKIRSLRLDIISGRMAVDGDGVDVVESTVSDTEI